MLGDKIRMFRKDKHKTMSEIAEMTGLSISYISQLERENIEPSLSALRKISKALDIPIYLFMEDNPTDDLVQRKDNRILMTFSQSPMEFEIASIMPTKSFEPSMLMTYFVQQPHSSDTEGFITHDSDELTLLLEGELEIVLGEKSIFLKEGDTLYIKKHLPHRYINHTDQIARGYVIFSPPMWPGRKN